ncbi:MAG: hypothetical protein ACOY90_14205 [Candidatus Zhuqueibacterota bacterium]
MKPGWRAANNQGLYLNRRLYRASVVESLRLTALTSLTIGI